MQNIISGGQDSKLQALAAAMKAAGKPVVLRWFWEMNLGHTANGRVACFDPTYDGKGAQAPDFFDPTHYIGAWRLEGVRALSSLITPVGTAAGAGPSMERA